MDVVTIGSIGTSAYGLRYGILHLVSAQQGNTLVANSNMLVTIVGTYRDISNIGQTISQTVEMSSVTPGFIDVAVPAPGRYAIAFSVFSSGAYTGRPDPAQEITINAGQCVTVKQLTTKCWGGIKNIINAHKEKEYFKACDVLSQDLDLTLDTEESGTGIRYAIEVATVDTLPNHPHAVVFNTVQVLPHKTTMYVKTGNKPNNQTGYKFTNVAAYLDDAFFNMLPGDLKNVITPREFVGASGAANKKFPMTECHRVWAPTFTDLCPAYSNAEALRWYTGNTTYPDNNEYYESIGFQASSIDIAVQNVSKVIHDADNNKYRPGSWGRAIRYPHYAKPVAGSATLTTYASSKGYSLPSDIELCRIKTVGQNWVIPQEGLNQAYTSNDVPMLFTMSGCQYWLATPDRKTATGYWVANSVFSTAALASTAAAGISAASTYAKGSKAEPIPLGMTVVPSNISYNILPYFMIAADDEYIDG